MTAIYIRTVDKEESHWNDIWQLPEGINAEDEISKMTAYATKCGFTDLIFYVDNGYEGRSACDPALIALHREVMADHVETVIISDLHQIAGGMNILMMTEETFTEHHTKLIIASYDAEAKDVIRQNYDAWIDQELDHSMQQVKDREGVPVNRAIRQLKHGMRSDHRRYITDVRSAKPVEPKYTADGYRLIDAEEALWLLKNKYRELER